jgi:hypothetical protein
MSRSTNIEDLDDEQDVFEEQEEQEEQEETQVPIAVNKNQGYSTTLLEIYKKHLLRNIKEVLLVICLVLLSHNRQITETLKSLLKSVGASDNQYVLLLKGLISGGFFLIVKVYMNPL